MKNKHEFKLLINFHQLVLKIAPPAISKASVVVRIGIQSVESPNQPIIFNKECEFMNSQIEMQSSIYSHPRKQIYHDKFAFFDLFLINSNVANLIATIKINLVDFITFDENQNNSFLNQIIYLPKESQFQGKLTFSIQMQIQSPLQKINNSRNSSKQTKVSSLIKSRNTSISQEQKIQNKQIVSQQIYQSKGNYNQNRYSKSPQKFYTQNFSESKLIDNQKQIIYFPPKSKIKQVQHLEKLQKNALEDISGDIIQKKCEIKQEQLNNSQKFDLQGSIFSEEKSFISQQKFKKESETILFYRENCKKFEKIIKTQKDKIEKQTTEIDQLNNQLGKIQTERDNLSKEIQQIKEDQEVQSHLQIDEFEKSLVNQREELLKLNENKIILEKDLQSKHSINDIQLQKINQYKLKLQELKNHLLLYKDSNASQTKILLSQMQKNFEEQIKLLKLKSKQLKNKLADQNTMINQYDSIVQEKQRIQYKNEILLTENNNLLQCLTEIDQKSLHPINNVSSFTTKSHVAESNHEHQAFQLYISKISSDFEQQKQYSQIKINDLENKLQQFQNQNVENLSKIKQLAHSMEIANQEIYQKDNTITELLKEQNALEEQLYVFKRKLADIMNLLLENGLSNLIDEIERKFQFKNDVRESESSPMSRNNFQEIQTIQDQQFQNLDKLVQQQYFENAYNGCYPFIQINKNKILSKFFLRIAQNQIQWAESNQVINDPKYNKKIEISNILKLEVGKCYGQLYEQCQIKNEQLYQSMFCIKLQCKSGKIQEMEMHYNYVLYTLSYFYNTISKKPILSVGQFLWQKFRCHYNSLKQEVARQVSQSNLAQLPSNNRDKINYSLILLKKLLNSIMKKEINNSFKKKYNLK